MTVGEYLKFLLKQKSVSVSDLSHKMGLSSRNEIYRLFGGNQSFEKSRELINAIVGLVPFTEEETEKIYTLLNDFRGGKYADDVKRILINLFAAKPEGFAVNQGKLSDALMSGAGKKIFIISGIRSEKIIQDIYEYLSRRPNAAVYHYMRFSRSDTLTAYEIFALIKLSKFLNYIPLETDREIPSSMQIVSKNKAEHRLQIVELSEGMESLFETEITADMYKYILEKNAKMQSVSSPIKNRVHRVENYMEALGKTLEIEEGDSFYCEGAPCFGYLTMDILYDMFKEIDFFGYPESHPYVQYLITHMTEKHERLHTLGHKRFLYDEKRIRDMMKTGIAIDHISEFPPISIERRRKYFRWLIDYLKRGGGNIRCRMLKDITIEHSFVYEEGHMLYMYRPNTKSNDMDVSIIMLRNKNVDEVMKHFTEYIWDKFTLSEEKTAARLEALMMKCLGI